MIAVRGFHKFSTAEGLVGVDVARAIKPPTPARKLSKAFPLDDIISLLEASGGGAAGDGPRDLRDRVLSELLYSTGVRISEAIDLDDDDIDTESRSVVLEGKGGKQRVVPVGRPADCRHCSSTHAVDDSHIKVPGRSCKMRQPLPESKPMYRRTPCGTRSPHICSTGELTFVWSRNSVTYRSPQPRFTP